MLLDIRSTLDLDRASIALMREYSPDGVGHQLDRVANPGEICTVI
jgi:hypothetical protein